jgi:hypothetical protein
MALTREQILAADDLGLLEVNVPGWSGSLFIRVMTCGERDSYENDWVVNKGKGVENFRAKFLARCLTDAKGQRLFADADVPLLAGKSAAVLNALFAKAMAHNALSDKDVEELAKN